MLINPQAHLQRRRHKRAAGVGGQPIERRCLAASEADGRVARGDSTERSGVDQQVAWNQRDSQSRHK